MNSNEGSLSSVGFSGASSSLSARIRRAISSSETPARAARLSKRAVSSSFKPRVIDVTLTSVRSLVEAHESGHGRLPVLVRSGHRHAARGVDANSLPGCRGCPALVTPSDTSGAPASSRRTARSRSFPMLRRSTPGAPHAAMTNPAALVTSARWASVSGPTGSSAITSSAGYGVMKANKFTIRAAPIPSRLEKSITLVTVGSSTTSSATDGFSMIHAAVGPFAQRRWSQYRYIRQSLSSASRSTGTRIASPAVPVNTPVARRATSGSQCGS